MGRNRLPQRRAVFLDRDGVINRNVWNPATGECEAPLTAADFEFLPGVVDAMRTLRNAGFLLFLVSNQPNCAKGKSTRSDLQAIHCKFTSLLLQERIEFADFYYCLHHPAGIGNRYSRRCNCRKPSPHFLLKARARFNLDLGLSWMIGDRLTDVECGNLAGAKTILIARLSSCTASEPQPDGVALDLAGAVRIILDANGTV